ncbi:MAG: hypothetical protein WCX32_01605 [Clostridia bacterium]|jgi:hypothetical protein|nr:hypothetical protein [Clostridia bacterium]
MDKKLISKLFSGLLIIAYGGILFFQSIYSFGPVQLVNIWYYGLLIVFGLILISRSISRNIDSSLWLGLTLTIYGSLGCFIKYTDFTYGQLWPTFIAAFAISSLAVFIFFKKYNHLKLFVFFGGISVALYLQSFSIITVIMLIPSLIILVGLMVLVNCLLPHKNLY